MILDCMSIVINFIYKECRPPAQDKEKPRFSRTREKMIIMNCNSTQNEQLIQMKNYGKMQNMTTCIYKESEGVGQTKNPSSHT